MKPLLRALYAGWMKFAHVLGWVNGRIILTVLYVVIIGPYAIVRKTAKLFICCDEKESLWIKKEQTEPDMESLRRIF